MKKLARKFGPLAAALALALLITMEWSPSLSDMERQPQDIISSIIAFYSDGTFRRDPTEEEKSEDGTDALVLKILRRTFSTRENRCVPLGEGLDGNHIWMWMSVRELREFDGDFEFLEKTADAPLAYTRETRSFKGLRVPLDSSNWCVTLGFALPFGSTEELRERRFLMVAFYLPESLDTLTNCTAEPGPWTGSTVYRYSPEFLESLPYHDDDTVNGVSCFTPGLPAKSYAIVTRDEQGGVSSVARCNVSEFRPPQHSRRNRCRVYFRWRESWEIALFIHESSINELPVLMEKARLLFDRYEQLARETPAEPDQS